MVYIINTVKAGKVWAFSTKCGEIGVGFDSKAFAQEIENSHNCNAPEFCK